MNENVIILRDKEWGRGQTGGALRYNGRYCILGCALRTLGAEPEEDQAMPTREQEDLLREAGLKDLRALMDLNDSGGYSDETRVEWANELLAGTGWAVVFAPEQEQVQ